MMKSSTRRTTCCNGGSLYRPWNEHKTIDLVTNSIRIPKRNNFKLFLLGGSSVDPGSRGESVEGGGRSFLRAPLSFPQAPTLPATTRVFPVHPLYRRRDPHTSAAPN